MLLGAIDVGTNSIHLIVVRLDPDFGTATVLLKDREMVRLGGGSALLRRYLGRKAFTRGIDAIKRFGEAARGQGAVDVRAVATSAVREAANGNEFAERVRAESGLELEILSGTEEARLIHLGVTRGFSLGERIGCIVDIGGGSTELIVGDGHRPLFMHSIPLGSLRLFDQYLSEDPIGPGAYASLERAVRQALRPVAAQIHDFALDMMIGTSGTIMGLAHLDAGAHGQALERVHGYELRLDRLLELQEQMLRMSVSERRRMPGMNARRSDIIVAGNAVLIGVLEALGRTSLIVCDRALREGIVADYVERNFALKRRLGDQQLRRLDAVHALAERYQRNGAHERAVEALAVALFDQLSAVHGLGTSDREILYAAAALHDVGMHINPSAHHKHSAYLLRNSAMDGWREEDVALMAAIVRYHRKALPKASHPEWVALTPHDQMRAERIGALLRLADGLDSRHLGLVSGVDVQRREGKVHITASSSQAIHEELAGALAKADLFERAFDLRVVMHGRFAAESDESRVGISTP